MIQGAIVLVAAVLLLFKDHLSDLGDLFREVRGSPDVLTVGAGV